jgi:hypothetical protein
MCFDRFVGPLAVAMSMAERLSILSVRAVSGARERWKGRPAGERRETLHSDARLRIHLASRAACDAATYSDLALDRLAITCLELQTWTRSPAKENAIPVRESLVPGQEAQSESTHASSSVGDGFGGLCFVYMTPMSRFPFTYRDRRLSACSWRSHGSLMWDESADVIMAIS